MLWLDLNRAGPGRDGLSNTTRLRTIAYRGGEWLVATATMFALPATTAPFLAAALLLTAVPLVAAIIAGIVLHALNARVLGRETC